MDRKIILISKMNNDLEKIIRILSENGYEQHRIDSIAQVEETLQRIAPGCILLDIDFIDIDNRTVRELTIRYPSVYFLCMSKNRFHPELKDAICHNIYACLTKPLDPDELLYWLRCIDNELDSSLYNNMETK